MPIHLDELEVVPEVEGSDSAMIVACNMCAGASCAQRENKPFIEFFRTLLKSPPLERYIERLSTELNQHGVRAEKFKAGVIQQFFLCLWTSRQRRQFRERARQHEAVIVLGCDSAIRTVRDSVAGTGCRVVKGMKVAGVTNTKTRVSWSGKIYFDDSKAAKMCDRHCRRVDPTSRGMRKRAQVLRSEESKPPIMCAHCSAA